VSVKQPNSEIVICKDALLIVHGVIGLNGTYVPGHVVAACKVERDQF